MNVGKTTITQRLLNLIPDDDLNNGTISSELLEQALTIIKKTTAISPKEIKSFIKPLRTNPTMTRIVHFAIRPYAQYLHLDQELKKIVFDSLEDILDGDPRDQQEGLSHWFKQYSAYFDSTTIASLDTYDLFLLASISNHNHEDAKILFHNLPKEAKQFCTALESPEPVLSLVKIFNPLNKSQKYYEALACYVYCKKLNIDDLTALIGWAELTRLAPSLRYADFEGIDEDGTLRILKMTKSLSHVFLKGSVLTALPHVVSSVKVLDCSNSALKSAPQKMPYLRRLNCFNCAALNALPQKLPLLKILNCSLCRQLTSLPAAMPLLKFLECWGSPIEKLPPGLHALKLLECSGCLLNEISNDLHSIEFIECFDNPKLERLPINMPKLIGLNCANAPKLRNLPQDAPLLQILLAYNNPLIQNLPQALPHLVKLDVHNCLSLQGDMPEVPWTVKTVNVDNTPLEFNKFGVDLDVLEKNPKSVLVDLARTGFLKNNSFPNIYLFSNGEISENDSISSRKAAFISLLMENLFTFDAKDKGRLFLLSQGVPVANDKFDSKDAFQALGYIMGLCFQKNSSLKTGPLLPSQIYFLIANTSKISFTDLVNTLNVDGEDARGIIKALKYLKNGIRSAVSESDWEEFCSMQCNALKSRIEGRSENLLGKRNIGLQDTRERKKTKI